MQLSDDNFQQYNVADEQPGWVLAVIAETLFLLNLLLLPVIAFIILTVIYLFYYKQATPLARCHIRQTFFASIWAGVMLVLVNALILLLGGYDSPFTWLVVILYFTTIHATFIFLGVFGLSRALNSKHYHFPLIGSGCTETEK